MQKSYKEKISEYEDKLTEQRKVKNKKITRLRKELKELESNKGFIVKKLQLYDKRLKKWWPYRILINSRLFVSFRPNDKILDEISTTSGYEYNSQNSITAKSGKSKYKFDIAQENFAWIADAKIEKKMVKKMKKASRMMVTGYNQSGSQTIDHYSLMGFTKAYNVAKKSCI